jgi:hypothetical protein
LQPVIKKWMSYERKSKTLQYLQSSVLDEVELEETLDDK